MMTVADLRKHLIHLINTYVGDPSVAARLLALTEREPVPTKGILAELDPHLSGKMNSEDSQLVKEIAFNYC